METGRKSDSRIVRLIRGDSCTTILSNEMHFLSRQIVYSGCFTKWVLDMHELSRESNEIFIRKAKKKEASKKDRNTYKESLSLKGAKRHPSLLC